MVHIYAFVVEILIFSRLLKRGGKYAIAVVSSGMYALNSNKCLLLSMGLLCGKKIIIIKDLGKYQECVEKAIKSFPEKEILVAVYNCGVNIGIYDAIVKCLRMMDILESSPSHQCMWVTSDATGKSRV